MTASTAPTKSSTAALAPLPAAVNRHDDLQAMLRRLNLSHIAGTFTETALKAAKANLSHEAFLYEVATQECAFRTQRRIARHLHESHLPREKTFTTLHLDHFSPALQLQIERLTSSCSATPSCGRPLRLSSSACWPPSGTCGCRSSSPNWITSPASSSTTSATSNMTATRWRSCLPCSPSATNAAASS